MLKKVLGKIKKGMKMVFVKTKADKWAENQIKEMAKLGGRLVL
jgi:hypothetical protein